MKWPGRPSTHRRPVVEDRRPDAAEVAVPARPEAASRSFAVGAVAPFERAVAAQLVTEHGRDLQRLSDDIDRLSASMAATGSLVEELAIELTRELDRLHDASVAWEQRSSDR